LFVFWREVRNCLTALAGWIGVWGRTLLAGDCFCAPSRSRHPPEQAWWKKKHSKETIDRQKDDEIKGRLEQQKKKRTRPPAPGPPTPGRGVRGGPTLCSTAHTPPPPTHSPRPFRPPDPLPRITTPPLPRSDGVRCCVWGRWSHGGRQPLTGGGASSGPGGEVAKTQHKGKIVLPG